LCAVIAADSSNAGKEDADEAAKKTGHSVEVVDSTRVMETKPAKEDLLKTCKAERADDT
jgi:hypothetical protein